MIWKNALRHPQVEGALSRRNDLLQLRVAAELARARALAQQGNKRGGRRWSGCWGWAAAAVRAPHTAIHHHHLERPQSACGNCFPTHAGALAALRRKRMYEAQLGAVETQQLRLSEQQVGLEGVHAAAQAAASLRLSAAAGAASLGQLSSEEVGDLVEGAAEAAHAAAELQAVLGAPLGASVDEEELAAELAVSGACMQAHMCLLHTKWGPDSSWLLVPPFHPLPLPPAGAGSGTAGGGCGAAGGSPRGQGAAGASAPAAAASGGRSSSSQHAHRPPQAACQDAVAARGGGGARGGVGMKQYNAPSSQPADLHLSMNAAPQLYAQMSYVAAACS